MENQINLEERLLAELAWLKKLASSLIRDPGAADDVVQDVLLGSLQSGESSSSQQTLRRSLFSMLKTRAFNRRRETARRLIREQTYAKSGVDKRRTGDAARIVAEADTAELLMREVMALHESHRAILLL
ncbi:MAG: hypothetical protein AAF085_01395, partial [Planctomycetota bacterium]